MGRPPKLKTRKPTGKVAFPLIVVDGFEKSGKSSTAFKLSGSEHVGRTFVCELGEPTADEYAALGDYDILVHDGTYHSMMGQLRAACAEPMTDGKPNVIIFDTATALYDMLGTWIDERARSSESARAKLRDDPDAEIRPHMALWNDRKKRFEDFIDLLRDWTGIAVVVCHGKEVTQVGPDGKPVDRGPKEYKVDVSPYLLKQANARVHCEGAEGGWRTSLRFGRSTPIRLEDGTIDWAVKVPREGVSLEVPNPLEHVVFNVLKAGREFQPSSAISPSIENDEVLTVAKAKQGLVSRLTARFGDAAPTEAAAIWKKVAAKHGGDPVGPELWTALCARAAERIAEADTAPAVDTEDETATAIDVAEQQEDAA